VLYTIVRILQHLLIILIFPCFTLRGLWWMKEIKKTKIWVSGFRICFLERFLKFFPLRFGTGHTRRVNAVSGKYKSFKKCLQNPYGAVYLLLHFILLLLAIRLPQPSFCYPSILTRSHTEVSVWKVIKNMTRTLWKWNFRNVYCFTPECCNRQDNYQC
jgi:hypothetical protein